ncbi:sigma-70 family RNA polymerase sigma factor [soil metagenome]
MSEQAEADAHAADLLARVAGGDEEALAELYDLFSGILFGLVYKIVLQRAEAEDVLQEVFVTVWKKAGSYERSKGRPVTWLMTTARNRSLNRLRSSRRRSATLESAKDEGCLPGTGPPGVEDGVLALPDETAALVRSALATLPDGQRRAIELAYFGGCSHQEVARLMKCPLGSVKGWIWRGLSAMRRHLADVVKADESGHGNGPGL